MRDREAVCGCCKDGGKSLDSAGCRLFNPCPRCSINARVNQYLFCNISRNFCSACVGNGRRSKFSAFSQQAVICRHFSEGGLGGPRGLGSETRSRFALDDGSGDDGNGDAGSGDNESGEDGSGDDGSGDDRGGDDRSGNDGSGDDENEVDGSGEDRSEEASLVD